MAGPRYPEAAVKGTDVTKEELAHAAKFLSMTEKNIEHHERFAVSREMLVRLLAWYGAIRAHRAVPGEIVDREGGPQ